jgi:hypothetical protein
VDFVFIMFGVQKSTTDLPELAFRHLHAPQPALNNNSHAREHAAITFSGFRGITEGECVSAGFDDGWAEPTGF